MLKLHRQHLLRAAALPNPAPSIYLYLAQLAETPQEALQHFGTAYTLLSSRLDNAAGSSEEAELRRSASRALIGMTELYLTDLWYGCSLLLLACLSLRYSFEADAEQKCTEYLDQAALVDPTDSEIYQTLASVRLSQHKIDEARQALQRAWSIWKDEPEGMPRAG
jgi:tetratricopeptide (TPR) repeat protein